MKLKRFAVRGLIVFAVVVALCMFFSGTVRTITTAKVKLYTPRTGKFTQEVKLTGTVVFPKARPVKLEGAQNLSLTVTAVNVQPGSEVEAGDVLFSAEIADFDKNMDALVESYNEAASGLAELERKNSGLRLRPTDEAWASAYAALSQAQSDELEARVALEARLAVEGLTAAGDSLPEGASEELAQAWNAHQTAAEALAAAEAQMQDAERYNISDEARAYITEKRKFETQKAEKEQSMVELRVLREKLAAVTAPEDGYVTQLNVKVGEAFDANGDAYSFCPASEAPALRVDTSSAGLAVSRGTDIAFDTPRGGSIEGSIDSTGMTTAGATYADMELSRRDIRDMGGSVAMLSGSYEVRVQYRSEQNTTLLPSGAVRGSGEERFVYVVEQRQSAFGETSLVTRKQEVTVLAEAGGVASVQEDLSYIQVAYMEDREIGENTTVMEYVN